MTQFRGKHAYIGYYLAAGAAAIALNAGMAGTAFAQAAPAQAKVRVNIPAGTLAKSLMLLGRQANVQIAFLPDRVRGLRAPSLRGNLTVEEALDRLLTGTVLRHQRTPNGSYVVGGPSAENQAKIKRVLEDANTAQGRDADGKIAVPDILVIGQRNWNLNLDIPRTADDAQPYVVFKHDEIVSAPAQPISTISSATISAPTNSGSTVAAAGASARARAWSICAAWARTATLILVDGRRYAEANTGAGVFLQSSVNGIPLDLDRADRSARLLRFRHLRQQRRRRRGQHHHPPRLSRHRGDGLLRQHHPHRCGGEETNPQRQLSTGEWPQTRLSFSGSWQQTEGLIEGDRDYIAQGRALIAKNRPDYFSTNRILLQGSTPNIMSDNGSNLVLDNGTALGSNMTFVPVGFRGVALDGTAALVANAGRQNMELSPTSTSGTGGNGKLSPLLTPSRNYSGSVTGRREFNSWLSLYGEFAYSRYESAYTANPRRRTTRLAANAPDNPFTTAIRVSVPGIGQETRRKNVSTNMRALAGAIVKLPYDWQAAIDLNWNWGRFESGGSSRFRRGDQHRAQPGHDRRAA